MRTRYEVFLAHRTFHVPIHPQVLELWGMEGASHKISTGGITKSMLPRRPKVSGKVDLRRPTKRLFENGGKEISTKMMNEVQDMSTCGHPPFVEAQTTRLSGWFRAYGPGS